MIKWRPQLVADFLLQIEIQLVCLLTLISFIIGIERTEK